MGHSVMQNQDEITAFESLDVELRNVFKFFDQEPAVHGIDLDVRQGEFFSILGPSGCGKTTTLRLIAGFEKADAGKILIQGQSMSNVPPYRRPVNTVFQSYALFNHLNIWDNIAFGLRLKRLPKAEVETRVKEALKTGEDGRLAIALSQPTFWRSTTTCSIGTSISQSSSSVALR